MMDTEEFYIRVEKGKAVGHPIPGWNLRKFYPDLNPEKPPKGFERFTRVPHPELTIFDNHVDTEYVKTNYGWTDNHIIEKNDVTITDIESPKDTGNYPPKPDDGQEYFWSVSAERWINYSVFDKIFGDFLRKNKIKYENIEFKTLEEMYELSEEQKNKFRELIDEYNKIVNQV